MPRVLADSLPRGLPCRGVEAENLGCFAMAVRVEQLRIADTLDAGRMQSQEPVDERADLLARHFGSATDQDRCVAHDALARTSDAEQRLMLLAALDTCRKRIDGLRLVARGPEVGNDLKLGHAHRILICTSL